LMPTGDISLDNTVVLYKAPKTLDPNKL